MAATALAVPDVSANYEVLSFKDAWAGFSEAARLAPAVGSCLLLGGIFKSDYFGKI